MIEKSSVSGDGYYVVLCERGAGGYVVQERTSCFYPCKVVRSELAETYDAGRAILERWTGECRRVAAERREAALLASGRAVWRMAY